MGEEKLLSSSHVHRYTRDGDAHFEEIAKLGAGGSAEVAHVRHILSRKEFACKRIVRDQNGTWHRKSNILYSIVQRYFSEGQVLELTYVIQ